eukprot:gene10389-9157_t
MASWPTVFVLAAAAPGPASAAVPVYDCNAPTHYECSKQVRGGCIEAYARALVVPTAMAQIGHQAAGLITSYVDNYPTLRNVLRPYYKTKEGAAVVAGFLHAAEQQVPEAVAEI